MAIAPLVQACFVDKAFAKIANALDFTLPDRLWE
jgi:hypothetical protein